MKSTTALLIAAVVVGAVLRGYQAGESLWLDELHTSWSVSGSLSEVAERAMVGNQSPLYFWVAWFFARLPLLPEIALRLPSLLAGCALPLAVFWLAGKFVLKDENQEDSTAPLLATWLVVVDPLAIFYSQEARPYAILLLTTVIHFGLLWDVVARNDWRARIAWIMTGAIMVHLHYTATLVICAEVVALLLIAIADARQHKELSIDSTASGVRDYLLARLTDGLLLALLLLPALPGMLAVAERRENWISLGNQPWSEMLKLYPWTIASIMLLALNHWRAAVSQRSLILLACWSFLPLMFAWTAAQLKWAPLFHQRFLVATMPASLIAAAACLRFAGNTALQAMLVGLMLALAVGNSGMIRNWRHDGRLLHERNDHWSAAIRALNERLAGDLGPVLVRSGWLEADELSQRHDVLFREYCLAPVRGAYRLNCADELLHPLTTSTPGSIDAGARSALLKHGKAWLLVRSSQSTREQLLRDLQTSLGHDYRLDAAEPETFGSVYLISLTITVAEP